jgi:hypothetical protein
MVEGGKQRNVNKPTNIVASSFMVFIFALAYSLSGPRLWPELHFFRSRVLPVWYQYRCFADEGERHLLIQTQALLGGDNTNGVGVSLTTAPTLDADDAVATADDAELDTMGDTPFETAVHILLPDLDVEVRLLLGEVEGVHATVQVGIPRGSVVTGDHNDRADGAVLSQQTSSFATSSKSVIQADETQNKNNSDSYLVVKTRMAPEFNSRLALTADMAIASEVSAGRGQRVRNSSKMLK